MGEGVGGTKMSFIFGGGARGGAPWPRMVALKSSDLAWPCRRALSGELLPSRRLPIGRRDPPGILEGDESLGRALLLREWPGLIGAGPGADPMTEAPITDEPKVDADIGLWRTLPPAVGVLLRLGGGPRIVLALPCDVCGLPALCGLGALLGGPSRLGGKAFGVLLLGGRAIAALASSSSKYLRP
jgi:hypothetical protein